MTLSVLNLGLDGGCILYDCDKEKTLLFGSRAEMFDWKDVFENMERHLSNRAYMKKLKEERLALLKSAGHTHKNATEFLKTNMPYLYE